MLAGRRRALHRNVLVGFAPPDRPTMSMELEQPPTMSMELEQPQSASPLFAMGMLKLSASA